MIKNCAHSKIKVYGVVRGAVKIG